MSLDRGKKLLQEKYKHLAEDPDLYQMVDRNTVGIAREYPEWEPEQIIKESAERVDKWLKKFKPEEDKPDLIAERKERKKSIDNIVTATTKKPAVTQKAKTPGQIFEEMKKARSR
jgi:biotin-(acetyl-CoA carboxylase) ligase